MGSSVIPPRLVDGRSALEWNRIALRAIVAAAAGGVVLFLSSFVDLDLVRLPIGLGAGAVVVVASVVMGVAGIEGLGASSRERRAGYTTVFGANLDLWQLDPATGAVVRRPSGLADHETDL
jgi:hypothetical protein